MSEPFDFVNYRQNKLKEQIEQSAQTQLDSIYEHVTKMLDAWKTLQRHNSSIPHLFAPLPDRDITNLPRSLIQSTLTQYQQTNTTSEQGDRRIEELTQKLVNGNSNYLQNKLAKATGSEVPVGLVDQLRQAINKKNTKVVSELLEQVKKTRNDQYERQLRTLKKEGIWPVEDVWLRKNPPVNLAQRVERIKNNELAPQVRKPSTPDRRSALDFRTSSLSQLEHGQSRKTLTKQLSELSF